METRLPIPKNWQDFEMLCHKLWRDIWSDPNAQRNGRQGQAQHGVDVWGQPLYSGAVAGVQCKDKDGRLGSGLSSGELEEECVKARSFEPALRSYTVATTASRDSSIQEYARDLTVKNVFPFPVSVWSWDDIEEEIRFRPALVKAYFPDVALVDQDTGTVSASPIYYPEQFEAFFSRPDIQFRIQPGLRRLLRSLSYELSDNAFKHGRASSFSIVSEEAKIIFEDNGAAFDPLVGLDASKVSADSHVGSYVVAGFRERFKDSLLLRYERVGSDRIGVNRLLLEFSGPTHSIIFEPSEVVVDMALAHARDGAERLAASIALPRDGSDLLLLIQDYFALSAIVMFIRCLLMRNRSDTKLIFSIPRDCGMEALPRLFEDPRVIFVFR